MLELGLILALNVVLFVVFRWWGKRIVRGVKLKRLQEAAHEWQQTNYLTPLRFYWNGSNPVLLWRRSDGEQFPLEID